MSVKWFWRPWDQQRAIDNAREASTVLARRRVEHEEVEQFLRARAVRTRRRASA